MSKITAQQKLFVDEYLKLRKSNQTQAALNAGYSKKTAQSQASQLLMKSNVTTYLQEREAEMAQGLWEEFIFDALEARKAMYEIMKDDTTENKDKISVAKDFLDRAGFKPEEKQRIEHEGMLKVEDVSPKDKLADKLQAMKGKEDG